MRITDVPRLLGGPAVADTVQPAQVRGTAEALSSLLGASSEDELELFCESINELSGLVGAVLADPANLGISAPEFWERTNGPRLLVISSTWSSCQTTLVRNLIALATHTTCDSPTAFAASIGLSDFCRNGELTLLRSMESVAEEEADPAQFFLRGFAARLALFCPDLFGTRRARIAGMRQGLARRQRDANHGPRTELTVSRTQTFSDSIDFLNGEVAGLGGFPIIRFQGEEGTDRGVEWFNRLAVQVFSESSTDVAGGLFGVRPGANCLELNASKPFDALTREHYVAVGRYLGLSVSQGTPIGAPLPRKFFRRLMNQAVTLDDVRLDHPELHRFLRLVESGGRDVVMDFLGLDEDDEVPSVAEFIAQRLADTVPAVLNERLAGIREGFNAVVPLEQVGSFVTPDDLFALVSVPAEISVEELIAHTTFVGSAFTGSSPQIGWLWDWLRRSSNDVRRRFLWFVTGSTDTPIGGMAELERPIFITRSTERDLLPHSSRVSFMLRLPVYRDAAELEQYMNTAIAQIQTQRHHPTL